MVLSFVFFSCISIYIGNAYGWSNPCLSPSNTNKPFCNPTKSFEDRAHDLVYNQIASLPNSTYIYQSLTGNVASAVPALSIPQYNWWNEALHGIMCGHGVHCGGDTSQFTMFPEPIGTASSFNATLFYEIGNVISTEGRAIFNQNKAGLTFWAPNINIFRDPRWGRGMETPGEDPFLNAVYGTNFVRGMQGYYDNTKYLKASSCCKHYADYSLESADGVSRHTFDAIVSQYDQNDTYLVAFKYCVIGGNASGVMCSYNEENSIPSCANKELMTNYLRQELGFNGYITSDCGAVKDVYVNHHYTNTSGATINAVFSAGMDLDCGSFTVYNTAAAVENGDAKLSDVQRAIYDAVLVQMRLGFFDNATNIENPYNAITPNDICTNSSLKLSLESSLQSIVMLKNENKILPLDINKYKTVALIGPNANNTIVVQGNYHGVAPFIYSVYNGFQTYYNNDSILYVEGCPMAQKNYTGFASSINAAKTADITVMVMGLDGSQEGEGHDRTSISMPGVQNELIGNITMYSKGPVILIMLSGGCVDISMWTDSNKIDGILWAGYPGMFGGLAVANVLYGDYNPSGRLSQTWYYTNYTQEILMSNMNMRPNKTTNSSGRGYRYYPNNVVYKFGDGMSYTTFSCSNVIVNSNKNGVSVIIKNTGNAKGSAIVLVYFIPKNAGSNGIPIKRLIAFGRVDQLKSSNSYNLTMSMYLEFVGSNEQLNGGQYVTSGACQ